MKILIPERFLLPNASERWTPLYLEHAKIHISGNGLLVKTSKKESDDSLEGKETSEIQIPSSCISCVILGPGVKITSSAIKKLAQHHTPIVWTGQNELVFYASGHGWTANNENAKKQARLWANNRKRQEIAKKMFFDRFDRKSNASTLQEFRLEEANKMRELYKIEAQNNNVIWTGRNQNLHTSDLPNKLITQSYQMLYAMAISAITLQGYIPHLGFVHEGTDLPFVYDIADKFKTTFGVSIALQIAGDKEFKGDKEKLLRETIAQKNQGHALMREIAETISKYLD